MLIHSGYALLVVDCQVCKNQKGIFMYPLLFDEFTIYMKQNPAGLVTNRVIFLSPF